MFASNQTVALLYPSTTRTIALPSIFCRLSLRLLGASLDVSRVCHESRAQNAPHETLSSRTGFITRRAKEKKKKIAPWCICEAAECKHIIIEDFAVIGLNTDFLFLLDTRYIFI